MLDTAAYAIGYSVIGVAAVGVAVSVAYVGYRGALATA